MQQQLQQQEQQPEQGPTVQIPAIPHNLEPQIIHAPRLPKALREKEAAAAQAAAGAFTAANGKDAEEIKALLESAASCQRLSKRELRHSYSAPGDCNEAKSVILSLIYGRYIPKGKRLPQQAQDNAGQARDTQGPKQGFPEWSPVPSPSPKPIPKEPPSRSASVLGVGSPALAEQFARMWGGGGGGRGKGSRNQSSRRSSRRTSSFSVASSSNLALPTAENFNSPLLALQRRRARKEYKPSQLSRALVSSFRFSQPSANPEKVMAAECLQALNTGRKTRHASMLLAALPTLGGLDDLELDFFKLHKESKVAGSSNESLPNNKPSTLEMLREARRRAMEDEDKEALIECDESGIEEYSPLGAKEIPVTPFSTASSNTKTNSATVSSASRTRAKSLRIPSPATSPPGFGSLLSPILRTAYAPPPLLASASVKRPGTAAEVSPPAKQGPAGGGAQPARVDRGSAGTVGIAPWQPYATAAISPFAPASPSKQVAWAMTSPQGGDARSAVPWSDLGAAQPLSSSGADRPHNSTGQLLDSRGQLLSSSAVRPLSSSSAGQPFNRSSSGLPLNSNSAGQPFNRSSSGLPLSSNNVGQPLSRTSTGLPLSSNNAGQPFSRTSTGLPLSSNNAGQPLSRTSTGRLHSRSGQPFDSSSGQLLSSSAGRPFGGISMGRPLSGSGQTLNSSAARPLSSSTGFSVHRNSSSSSSSQRKVKHSNSFGASSTSSPGIGSTAKLHKATSLPGKGSTPAVPAGGLVRGQGREGVPSTSTATATKSAGRRTPAMGLLSQALISSCSLNPDQPVCKLVAVDQMPSGKKGFRRSSTSMTSQLQAMCAPSTSSQRKGVNRSNSEGCNALDTAPPRKAPSLPENEEETAVMFGMA
uniref:Uncharacterized protein n=1 Tax=Dunaliella tertiolecta TaxID=3047 RepID=A0A7S3VKW3_DUNTE